MAQNSRNPGVDAGHDGGTIPIGIIKGGWVSGILPETGTCAGSSAYCPMMAA